MSRPLMLSVTAALLFAAAGPSQDVPKKSALDKATLEAYVRHLFVMKSDVNVQVSDPKPSQVPGFVEVVVHASKGDASANFPFLISKDGSKILQATVYDINSNPFKPDLDKLHTESQPSLGTPGAPVVLVVFSNFECPYCKVEATTLRQNLLTAYPTQVRLYFKDFPLESIHVWDKAAAIAGRCVFRQNPGLFWSYHDFIFAHQADMTAANLRDRVMEWTKGEKDIDVLQLGRCMDTKATEAEVDKNIAEGRALDINSTPTIFVNGRRIAQAIDWPNLRAIIDYEIEYQKTAKNAGEACCEVKLDTPGLSQKAPPAKK
ncbi:MAG: thioredoxin domain-containing protein [Bryobacteraceae bacterium]